MPGEKPDIAISREIRFARTVYLFDLSATRTFSKGETVLVRRMPPVAESFRPGDVIVFRSGDGVDLIKRIMYIQDQAGKENGIGNRFWVVDMAFWGTKGRRTDGRDGARGRWGEGIGRGDEELSEHD